MTSLLSVNHCDSTSAVWVVKDCIMSSYQDDNSIPLVDDDPSVVLDDDRTGASEISDSTRGQSLESIPSAYTNGSNSPLHSSLEPDMSPDEQEEKARLIAQVLELQNTLDDLSQRVDSVKEENLKLRSENQVLGQYIENLMSASSVFQSTSPKTKKKYCELKNTSEVSLQ
ncbi:short coiled-coil protein homolog isoform X3 [Panulirus ornatus]|uniref:short coiled-coil protein homolog isoform X3 n=1 Tax=Panulirus ornatus TaxID=150431 RepID=UPI003A86AA20